MYSIALQYHEEERSKLPLLIIIASRHPVGHP
jgi:hypothetical protein